jgi:hypothetical protein
MSKIDIVSSRDYSVMVIAQKGSVQEKQMLRVTDERFWQRDQVIAIELLYTFGVASAHAPDVLGYLGQSQYVYRPRDYDDAYVWEFAQPHLLGFQLTDGMEIVGAMPIDLIIRPLHEHAERSEYQLGGNDWPFFPQDDTYCVYMCRNCEQVSRTRVIPAPACPLAPGGCNWQRRYLGPKTEDWINGR